MTQFKGLKKHFKCPIISSLKIMNNFKKITISRQFSICNFGVVNLIVNLYAIITNFKHWKTK